MYGSRAKSDKARKSKKEKKLNKLIQNHSESEGEASEHELSHYVKDRVKLMKEVLKIMKPKKIKMMAPEFMKNMPMEEINSMLLEELLGISNKRLRYIFDGRTLEEDSSSEEEEDNADVISLDDISDGELIILDSDEERGSKKHRRHHHRRKIKEEPGTKKIKKEKPDKDSGNTTRRNKGKEVAKEKEPMGEENLMSVLELLELQARARAIRSQLTLEAEKKQQEAEQRRLAEEVKKQDDEDDDDEIIIEVPKNEEIVIPSESESDNDIEFTEETSQNANNAIMENPMENTPATAINEEIGDENKHSQNEEVVSEDKQSNSRNDQSENVINVVENCGRPVVDKKQNEINEKSGESSDPVEIGDWETQKSKLERELARLETVNQTEAEEVPKEAEASNLDCKSRNSDDDSSENDTLAVIAEREKRKAAKAKKKERKTKKSKKKNKSKEKEASDRSDLEKIELQSKEVENLMKTVEEKSQEIEESIECESKDEDTLDKDSKLGEVDVLTEKTEKSDSKVEDKVDKDSKLDKPTEEVEKSDSEPEEGEVATTSEESSDESSIDDFKGTVDEYKRLLEQANEPSIKDSEEPSTSELLGENVPDLEQQKKEEKAKNLREKRLRHMKGKLESYKKDMGTDSGSDKSSEKEVKIIESLVIKPGIKINSKSLKRRVEVDDNDEIVINIDQDDLDCIICD